MRVFRARAKMLWVVLVCLTVLPLSGCVYLVVGSLGALGGYVASPDTVEGTIIDRDYDRVWRRAQEVLSQMGMLTQSQETGGLLEADLQGTQVKVMVLSTGVNTVKISVKARKNFFPMIKSAQDVYVKIVQALEGEGWEE